MAALQALLGLVQTSPCCCQLPYDSQLEVAPCSAGVQHETDEGVMLWRCVMRRVQPGKEACSEEEAGCRSA